MGHGKSVLDIGASKQFKKQKQNQYNQIPKPLPPKKPSAKPWPHITSINTTRDKVEFGNTFYINGTLVDTEATVSGAYFTMMRDFFEAKKKFFPKWKGLPNVYLTDEMPSRFVLNWHAVVPSQYVIAEAEEEERLWNE